MPHVFPSARTFRPIFKPWLSQTRASAISRVDNIKYSEHIAWDVRSRASLTCACSNDHGGAQRLSNKLRILHPGSALFCRSIGLSIKSSIRGRIAPADKPL